MKRKYLKYGILPLIMICILICLPSERKRVKSAEKILTVEYNSGTLKQASETEASGTPVTEYKGLVVKGSRSLTGDDFEYMSMKWKHAESIDLRQHWWKMGKWETVLTFQGLLDRTGTEIPQECS